jgi:hypothetical protein
VKIDAFPYAGEQDMLFCRLTEIGDVIDKIILVEADVTHGHCEPKPYLFLEHQDRFARWADKIVYVQATGLPTHDDPWAREWAQREWTAEGLERCGATNDDILLYGDVDEIPRTLHARNVNPKNGIVRFHMRCHPFAVDWLHPTPWSGTVATKIGNIPETFALLRDARMDQERFTLQDAGWHLTWVSDSIEAKNAKMHAFCHPEIAPTWEGKLDACWETGIHVDGTALIPIADGDWPKWVREGNAPASWFRPETDRVRPNVQVPIIYGPNARQNIAAGL